MAITFMEMMPEIITLVFILAFIMMGRCFLDPIEKTTSDISEPFIKADDFKSLDHEHV